MGEDKAQKEEEMLNKLRTMREEAEREKTELDKLDELNIALVKKSLMKKVLLNPRFTTTVAPPAATGQPGVNRNLG